MKSLLSHLRSLVQRPPANGDAPYSEDPTPLPPDVEASLNQYQAVKEYIGKLEHLRTQLDELITAGESLLPVVRANQVRARYDEDASPLPQPTRMNPRPLWDLSIRNLLERGWNYETMEVLQQELKRRKMPDDVITRLARFD